MTTRTPCESTSTSPSSDPLSNPIAYWKPEQPPPSTARRRHPGLGIGRRQRLHALGGEFRELDHGPIVAAPPVIASAVRAASTPAVREAPSDGGSRVGCAYTVRSPPQTAPSTFRTGTRPWASTTPSQSNAAPSHSSRSTCGSPLTARGVSRSWTVRRVDRDEQAVRRDDRDHGARLDERRDGARGPAAAADDDRPRRPEEPTRGQLARGRRRQDAPRPRPCDAELGPPERAGARGDHERGRRDLDRPRRAHRAAASARPSGSPWRARPPRAPARARRRRCVDRPASAFAQASPLAPAPTIAIGSGTGFEPPRQVGQAHRALAAAGGGVRALAKPVDRARRHAHP